MISCDPNDLLEASKCFQCIPHARASMLRLALTCVWAGGTLPEDVEYLLQSEGDYIVLDDGGKIIIN